MWLSTFKWKYLGQIGLCWCAIRAFGVLGIVALTLSCQALLAPLTNPTQWFSFSNSHHHPMSSPASTTSLCHPPPQPVTELRLSTEELKICEKWTAFQSQCWYGWRGLEGSEVSEYPFIPESDMVFMKELATKKVVPKPCLWCINLILPIIFKEDFHQTSNLPWVQGGHCSNCEAIIWDDSWKARLYCCI